MSVRITSSTDRHLQGVLDLQEQNLKTNLSPEAIETEGFVTVHHDYAVLKAMNDFHPHTIALDGDQVVGYALAMSTKFADDIPFLVSLFERIDAHLDSLEHANPSNYIVMGQVCIAKGYRSQGIFKQMYHNLQERLSDQYQFIFTDISCENKRSLQAHKKVGFESIEIFETDGQMWDIVKWLW